MLLKPMSDILIDTRRDIWFCRHAEESNSLTEFISIATQSFWIVRLLRLSRQVVEINFILNLNHRFRPCSDMNTPYRELLTGGSDFLMPRLFSLLVVRNSLIVLGLEFFLLG